MVSKFLITLIFFSSYCFMGGLSQDMAALQEALKGAGGNPPSCLKAIVPCQAYLHSDKPPPECCGPLLDAMKTDMTCLCKLFENEQVLKSVNLTREDALKLPSRCDKKVDTSACDKIDTSSPDMAPGSSASESSTPPSGKAGSVSSSAEASSSAKAPAPSESRASKMSHFSGFSFVAVAAIFICAV